jgi:hypothetical protein
LALVERLFEFFRESLDQRDSPRLAPILAAADEVTYSLSAQPFAQAGVARHLRPLRTSSPGSPSRADAGRPPPELKSAEDVFRGSLLRLPVGGVIGLPPWCEEGPWTLVYWAHEVGHHVEVELAKERALVKSVRACIAAAERRLLAGGDADLRALLHDLETPPISEVGALSLDAFFKKSERKKLAASLNTLLASPTFASWRQGAALDVADWVTARDGRTPAVIVSVAHLDDEERALVLGVLLEEILSWVRSLPGSGRLKALIVFDEVYGFLPPHPANPPTKRPLVALMKQARSFGVGVIIATQNPMDLDYRALSNAGIWCVGRLQTDADRARVLDGLAASLDSSTENLAELGRRVQRLSNRWFVMRNAHVDAEPILLPAVRDVVAARADDAGEIQRARGVVAEGQRRSSAPPAPLPSAPDSETKPLHFP